MGAQESPKATHISASRALIKNRLDESSNLAQRDMHAKFQPNSTSRLASRLARAMGGSIFHVSFWRMSVNTYKHSALGPLRII